MSDTRAVLGLFGSDVFNAYPASYSWDSNQMAHTMMGFAGVTLVSQAATAFGHAPLWGAVFIVFPVLKDVFDLWIDRARQRSVEIYTRQPHHFRLQVGDALTDQSFWWGGGALSLFVVHGLALSGWDGVGALVPAALLLGSGILFGGRFRRERQRFDKSDLPYYFRLPNLDRGADPDGADNPPGPLRPPAFTAFVDTFVAAGAPRHLVIAGPSRSGRTLVPIGIACELLSVGREKQVRYLRWSELADLMADAARASAQDEPWNLGEAAVVIVDDTPFEPDFEGLSSAILGARKVIWTTNRSLGAEDGGAALDDLVRSISAFLDGGGPHEPVARLILGAPGGGAGNEYLIRHWRWASATTIAYLCLAVAALGLSLGALIG